MVKLNKNAGPKDLAVGGLLQMAEAASLGMPFEVWKTRCGRYRNETTIQAFKAVYQRGGIPAFWAGTGPKMVESATKGAILLFAKEKIADSMLSAGFSPTLTGFAAGAGGGISQVVVMGPCTFLVTAAVTGDKSISTTTHVKNTWAKSGIKGFYPGGTAIAFRQATNWASRQGFTEFVRLRMKMALYNDKDAKLTVGQEAASGMIGGALACWNHPFEVARIQMQSAAQAGEAQLGIHKVLTNVVKENGVGGLFKGVVPRIMLGMWQTLFMVSGAKVIKGYLDGDSK